jgi:hypothetical protein
MSMIPPHRETYHSINIPSPRDYNINLKQELDIPQDPQQKDYEYDPKDENYNYLINMSILKSETSERICITRNDKYTAILYLDNKQYEVWIMENIINNLGVKFKKVMNFPIPQLEYKEINLNGNNYINTFKSSKSNHSNSKNFHRSHSTITISNRLKNPVIYLCADNYLLIEDSKNIFLLDFIEKKITNLFNKSSDCNLNIISCYDELICVKKSDSLNLNSVKFPELKNSSTHLSTRSYVFLLSSKEEIYFFCLEKGYFQKLQINVKDNKGNKNLNFSSGLILSKIPFDSKSAKDFRVLKIYLPDPTENKWFYLFTILKESKVTFLTTDYTDSSLKIYLKNVKNDYTINSSVRSKSFALPFEKNFHIRKIFLSQQNLQTFIVIALGEHLIILKYNSLIIPKDMRKLLKIPEELTNDSNSHFFNSPTRRRSPSPNRSFTNSPNSDFKQRSETDISSIAALRKKSSFGVKFVDFHEAFLIFDISKFEIDFSDYSLCVIKDKIDKLLVISKSKILLFDPIKSFKFYEYFLKKDEFVNLISYPEYSISPILLTKRRLFKFRYNSKIVEFKEKITQLSYFEQGDIPIRSDLNNNSFNQSQQSNTNTGNLRNLLMSLGDNKRNSFSFDEFDYYYRNKINFLYEEFVNNKNSNKNEKIEAKTLSCDNCSLNINKSSFTPILCKKCHLSSFCTLEHESIEFSTFHFFECEIIQFLKFMKSYSGPHYTAQCLTQLLTFTNKILLQIFQFIEGSSDFQEHLIFLHLITDLLDKFGVCEFYKNMLKLLDLWPSGDQREKVKLHVYKIILIEISFNYVNLKMLYTKFCFDCGYIRIAGHSLDHLRELLAWLKKDSKLISGNEKGKIVILTGEKVTLKVDKSILRENPFIEFLEKNNYLDKLFISQSNTTNMSNTTNLFDKEIELKISDKFFINYIHTKSTLMKFYMKLNLPSGYYKDTILFLEEIAINFEDKFPENSTILCFVYFYISFYLIQNNKLHSAIGTFNRAFIIASREENSSSLFEMRIMCLFNLGILYYSLGAFDEGIHNLEEAHRLITTKNTSTYLHLKILEILSLAYINKKSFRKAFNMIQQSIAIRNLKFNEDTDGEMLKLKTYLNYIIDLVEHNLNSIKKANKWNTYDVVRNKEIDLERESKFLVDYVLTNGFDLSRQIADIYSESYVKVLQFLYSLIPEQLAQLNNDNKANMINNLDNHININGKEIATKDNTFLNVNFSNNSFTAPSSLINTPRDIVNTSNSLITISANNKETNINYFLTRDAYTLGMSEEIEIKKPFLNMLSASKQDSLKTLNANLFKRNLILRDEKGPIDHFNLNYHPIHTVQFQKIIENIRANFLIKEMTRGEISESKEEEIFECNVNNCLYGLAKYMRKANIQQMITLEKYKMSMKTKNRDIGRIQESSRILNQTNFANFGSTNKLVQTNNQFPPSNSRVIKYGEFLPFMLEKLSLFDYSDANDILFQIYSECDDNYLRYIMEHPEIVLHFIHNDVNLFDGKDAENNFNSNNPTIKKKGKGIFNNTPNGETLNSNSNVIKRSGINSINSKDSSEISENESEVESDSEKNRSSSKIEQDDISSPSMDENHSIKSGQRKFNLYGKFSEEDFNKGEDITKDKILKRIYTAVGFSGEKFERRENDSPKIKDSLNLRGSNLSILSHLNFDNSSDDIKTPSLVNKFTNPKKRSFSEKLLSLKDCRIKFFMDNLKRNSEQIKKTNKRKRTASGNKKNVKSRESPSRDRNTLRSIISSIMNPDRNKLLKTSGNDIEEGKNINSYDSPNEKKSTYMISNKNNATNVKDFPNDNFTLNNIESSGKEKQVKFISTNVNVAFTDITNYDNVMVPRMNVDDDSPNYYDKGVRNEYMHNKNNSVYTANTIANNNLIQSNPTMLQNASTKATFASKGGKLSLVSLNLNNNEYQSYKEKDGTVIIDDAGLLDYKSVESVNLIPKQQGVKNEENENKQELKNNNNEAGAVFKEIQVRENLDKKQACVNNIDDSNKAKIPLRYNQLLKKQKELEDKMIKKKEIKGASKSGNTTNKIYSNNKVPTTNTLPINKNISALQENKISNTSTIQKVAVVNNSSQINKFTKNKNNNSKTSNAKPSDNNFKINNTIQKGEDPKNKNSINKENFNEKNNINPKYEQKKLDDLYHFDYGFDEFIKNSEFSNLHTEIEENKSVISGKQKQRETLHSKENENTSQTQVIQHTISNPIEEDYKSTPGINFKQKTSSLSNHTEDMINYEMNSEINFKDTGNTHLFNFGTSRQIINDDSLINFDYHSDIKVIKENSPRFQFESNNEIFKESDLRLTLNTNQKHVVLLEDHDAGNLENHRGKIVHRESKRNSDFNNNESFDKPLINSVMELREVRESKININKSEENKRYTDYQSENLVPIAKSQISQNVESNLNEEVNLYHKERRSNPSVAKSPPVEIINRGNESIQIITEGSNSIKSTITVNEQDTDKSIQQIIITKQDNKQRLSFDDITKYSNNEEKNNLKILNKDTDKISSESYNIVNNSISSNFKVQENESILKSMLRNSLKRSSISVRKTIQNTQVYNVPSIPNIPSIPGGNFDNKNNNVPKIPVVPSIQNIQANIPSMVNVPRAPGPPGLPGVPGIPSGIPVRPGVPPIRPGAIGGIPMPINSKIPTKEKIKPNANMKPLYWNVLDPKKIQNTAWEKIDDASVIPLINASQLEEEFSVKKKIDSNTSNSSSLSNLKKPENISTLPPSRQQNINVVLSKLKLNYSTVCELLKSYDLKKLNQSACELLLQILPTESEITTIKGYEDISNFSDCDKFISYIGDIPGYDLRIKSIIFKNSFSFQIEEIKNKIDKIRNYVKLFQSDEKILEWLKIVLAYGNYLNGTSTRGGAFGFKLDTLNKIADIKSNDNKKTLLNFIVEWLINNQRNDLLEIKFDNQGGEISINVLNDLFRDLKKSFSSVVKLNDLKRQINDKDDKTEEFLHSFYPTADYEVCELEKCIKNIDIEYEKVCLFFGENIKDLPFETLMEIFVKFFKDVENTKNQILRQREVLQKSNKGFNNLNKK